MRRILVVTTTFPQWETDPRGAFLRRHWELVAAGGARVRVLAPRTAWCRGSLDTPLEVERIAYAPRICSTVTGNFGIVENIRARPWRALWVPSLWAALSRGVQRSIATFEPDLVCAHMLLPCGVCVAEACGPLGIPFELYGHGTDVDLLMRLPAAVRRRTVRFMDRAAAIHLPSAEKLARFRGAMGNSLADAPLRVETMVHALAPPTALTGPSPRRTNEILFLGRLIPQKGVDDLLLAVASIPGHPLLHIAGDGPCRRRLQRQAARLGLRVRFHGYVEGLAKERLLRRATVLCVPSRELAGGWSEGAPLVVREAIDRDLPVVATDVGGIPELGRVSSLVQMVPAGRPRALGQALASVLDEAARGSTTPNQLESQGLERASVRRVKSRARG